MDDNIFADRKERELQNLRQRGASNVVRINPDLRLFTQRFNPDVSRASLLQAQRARAVLDKSELEKIEGVKTAKKLKKRRGKNLRGEVARNLREQRRFERGERRDRPEQEPRIVGDPVPPVPGAPAPAAAAAPDPNAQLRFALDGRRIAAQDAQQRRLVDALMARDDAERGERQAILGRQAEERQVIIGRGEAERQAILDRNRAERGGILDRAEAERLDLRGAFRDVLEGESRFNRQERQDLLDQAGEERTALLRAGRVERDALIQDRQQLEQSQEAIRRRVEEQRIAERQEDRDERDRLLGRAQSALDRLGDEQRRERIQREDQQAAGQVAERERQRQERQQVSVQAAEEREGILRLLLDTDRPDPGNTPADRDFLQRQFQQGLETIDRRIGESEARTAEQIRQHADRVAAIERQPPINIQQQPAERPAPTGPSAEDIATAVRRQLESPRTRERRTTRRRIDIEEQSTDTEDEDFSPTRSARRREREGRGAVSPDIEDRQLIPREDQPLGFQPVSGSEEEGFSPVQSPRTTRTPQSTGIDAPVFVSQAEARGEPEPSQERVQVSDRGFRIGGTPQTTAELLGQAARNIAGGAVGTKNTIVEGISGALGFGQQEEGVVAEPAQRPTERIAELEGSGILVDPRNLPQEGGQDLYQSGQFAGDIEALAQNAIGFVGDAAGRAAGGIANLVNPEPAVGEQTGGGLVDADGNPIFGLGQEIEPVAPTIQPLQSEEPVRRP